MYHGGSWLKAVMSLEHAWELWSVHKGFIGFILLPFIDAPAPVSWPYLAASVVIYQANFCLVCLGYLFGALTQVYPIQRVITPILVAIRGYWFVDETLNTQGIISVSLISVAVQSFALVRDLTFTGGHAVPIALFTGPWLLATQLLVVLA